MLVEVEAVTLVPAPDPDPPPTPSHAHAPDPENQGDMNSHIVIRAVFWRHYFMQMTFLVAGASFLHYRHTFAKVGHSACENNLN